MIIFTLFCNVLKSLCIMLFYHMNVIIHMYFVNKGGVFSNYMNKKLSFLSFMVTIK
jgi:hypothetical protein